MKRSPREVKEKAHHQDILNDSGGHAGWHTRTNRRTMQSAAIAHSVDLGIRDTDEEARRGTIILREEQKVK